jgi:hypothetical protein
MLSLQLSIRSSEGTGSKIEIAFIYSVQLTIANH